MMLAKAKAKGRVNKTKLRLNASEKKKINCCRKKL